MTDPDYEIDDLDGCEMAGCRKLADYEGWARVLDPVIGKPTGLVIRMQVCEEHKPALIGADDQGVVSAGR